MTTPPARHPLIAFLGAVLAIGFLSAMDAAMKTVSLAYGAFAALAWRTVIATPLLALPYFLWRKAPPSRRAMRFHLVRGLMMVPMSFAFFYGLTYVPMAQAIALAFIAPLLALLLAGLFLGERVGRAIVTGSLLAFGGVLVIFFGQAQADLGRDALVGSFAILGSALLYSVNIVLMREQSRTAGPVEVAFYYFAVSGLGFWLVALFVGAPPLPRGEPVAMLLATLLAVVGMMGLAWAYARAEASYLSTTEYSGFVWGALFGFLVFGEVPSGWTLVGAGFIVAGSWIAARRRVEPGPSLEASP
ncbi:DMT family transporter [Sphingomicrobium astaxanthinifaciens]|uniref:DMT family transporter n=1 Tax=Sphingomicrobium astaxanthinifaciens TaxID=1227949 RepID=UPI001FCB729C|nr:DMT family transporter [Sphingomicrobium astaxanthinifaciens]MCJ7421088.1 DMT family transporter [Sphingomicrobium astaxanthinifaciens]